MEQLDLLNNLAKNEGTLIYSYMRGSHAYGLNTETSDIDTGGVFISRSDKILGLSEYYKDQIADEKNDNVIYEIGKFVELLIKSNPTMLEALFVSDRCILYKHPIFDIILKNRDVFITKQTINSLVSYSKAQIEKARGLNKKIVNPVTERKDILDFCFTFKGQGTQPFKKFLEDRGLYAKYCGLVHLPNMEQMYGVYYDFGNHFKHENISSYKDMPCELREFIMKDIDLNSKTVKNELIDEYIASTKFIGYRGAMDENNDTTQLRLSSVEKGAKPICYISFNENGFKTHCRQYKEYQEWVAKRNPQRYLENKEKEFDRKNMMHCARLLTMGIEIAKTGKMNVDRTNIDREFLLNIRLGNSTYDDLMNYMNSKLEELNESIETCTLPDSVDHEIVNKILIDIRNNIG